MTKPKPSDAQHAQRAHWMRLGQLSYALQLLKTMHSSTARIAMPPAVSTAINSSKSQLEWAIHNEFSNTDFSFIARPGRCPAKPLGKRHHKQLSEKRAAGR